MLATDLLNPVSCEMGPCIHVSDLFVIVIMFIYAELANNCLFVLKPVIAFKFNINEPKMKY